MFEIFIRVVCLSSEIRETYSQNSNRFLISLRLKIFKFLSNKLGQRKSQGKYRSITDAWYVINKQQVSTNITEESQTYTYWKFSWSLIKGSVITIRSLEGESSHTVDITRALYALMVHLVVHLEDVAFKVSYDIQLSPHFYRTRNDSSYNTHCINLSRW